jgi:hypothetical protein
MLGINFSRSEPKLHSYDISGARMLWKPKEARIFTNFIDQPDNLVNIRGSRMFDKVLNEEF